MKTIDVTDRKTVRAVVTAAQKRADHHGTAVSEVIDKLSGILFSNPSFTINVGTHNGRHTASLWLKKSSGESFFICFDHATRKIAVKTKKGGRILGHIDNNTRSLDIIDLLRIHK